MAKLPKAFKRKDHGEMKDFSSIPKGDYICKVTKSDYKENSKKNGHLLAVVFEVQNKEHKGAKIFVNLNLDNPNDTAVEIANNELATICDAIGKASIKDTDELMGKLMICSVSIDKDDRNKIDMYASMDSAGGGVGGDLEDEDLEEDKDKDKEEDEVTPEAVTKLAKKYKEMTSNKKLKEVLEEYDISKVKEIDDLDEDDLESLKEDLEEAIEDED